MILLQILKLNLFKISIAFIIKPTENIRQTNGSNPGIVESDNIVCLFTDDEMENENEEDSNLQKNKNTKNDLNNGTFIYI